MSDFSNAVADQAPAQEPTFEQTVATTTATQPQVSTTLEDGSIVVGGKIYKPEAAAKKIEHADTHIQTLEQENADKDAATLKLLERIEALEKNRNHADALDRLVEQQSVAQPIVMPEPAPIQEISKEELIQAAVDTIEGKRVQEQQEANKVACIADAQAAYGTDFGTKIDEMAAKAGITTDQAVAMAENQPLIFRKVFIPEGTASTKPDTTRSSTMSNIGQGGIAAPVGYKSVMKMNAKDRLAEINRRMNALSNPG